MKVLIIGGTIFLGRHIVEQAVARGHEVTLFFRGRHNPDLFPGVEKILGDRENDLKMLANRRWDAVVDTCGYVPRIVRQSARTLSECCGHYTFISSISVYADNSVPNMDETGAVGVLQDPTIETVDGETYGPLKALCEQAVEQEMPGRALVIRPGLIVGPNDPTDRYTYWPVRVADGGKVLVPANLEAPVQIIDVRDLAMWTLDMVQSGKTGIYNATGPEYRLSLGAMLESCVSPGIDVEFVRVDETWLEEHQVHAWSDIPAWVPDTPEMRGFSTTDCTRAISQGLVFRPQRDAAQDTLVWSRSRGADYKLRAGLTRERERELLCAYESRN